MSVGIFPASHVQIRDRLEDLDTLPSSTSAITTSPVPSSHPRRELAGQLAPLQEEEEEEFDENDMTRANIGIGSPSRRRLKNRLSGSSLSGLGTTTLSSIPATISRPASTHLKPSPPLPNLKCGDETLSGASEPLIDEIACALREWASHLFSAMYHRDYTKFHRLAQLIDACSAGRRQLLARQLGKHESRSLRKTLVAKLGEGNALLGLEVLVRHADWGGLVEVDVDASPTDVESRDDARHGWCSAVRMCEFNLLSDSHSHKLNPR